MEIRKQYNAIFNVVEGNAGLLKQPNSDVFTPPNIPGQQEIRIPIGKETTEPMVYVAYGKNPINPVKITANFEGKVIVDISFVDYNPNGGSSINDLPNFNFNYQNHTSYFYLGSPYVEIVTKEDGKFVAAEYVHSWQNIKKDSLETINKYWIRAKMPLNEPPITKCGVESWDDFRKITEDDGKSFGKTMVDDIPMKRSSNNGRYAEYISEVPLVFVRQNQSFENIEKFISDKYVYVQAHSFCFPFAFSDDKEAGIQRYTPYLEIFGPGVYGKDDKKWIRATLTDPNFLGEDKDKGNLSIPDVFTNKVRELPQIFTFKSILNEKLKIDLFYKPHNLQSYMKLDIESFNLQNQKEMSRLQIDLKRAANIFEIMKKNKHPQTEIKKKQIEDIKRKIDGISKESKFQIVLKDKKTNTEIFLADGEKDFPSVVLSAVLDKPILAIPHVAQGGKLIARIKISGKIYEDSIVIVKGLTWNDYQRLKNKGKELRIHKELQNLPLEIQENVINTIKFCLDPKGNQLQIEKVQQQIKENKEKYPHWNKRENAKQISELLPEIPSAMSILPNFETNVTGDLFHFHLFWHNHNKVLEDICQNHITQSLSLYKEMVNFGISVSLTMESISKEEIRIKIIEHYNKTMFSQIATISHIEMFEEVIKMSDRPYCEYHTYEWAVEGTEKAYSTPDHKFSLRSASPIRYIFTYLKNTTIKTELGELKNYEANRPTLFLPLHAYAQDGYKDSRNQTYHAIGDFLFQEKNQVYLEDLNAKTIPEVWSKNLPDGFKTIKVIEGESNEWWIWCMEKEYVGKEKYNKIHYIFCADNELNIYDSSGNYNSLQIDFFVDKEGQVVITPFQYGYYDNISSASLLIADALEEEIFIESKHK